MKLSKSATAISLAILLALTVAACDSTADEVELTTTSSIVGSTTEPNPNPTSTESGETTTTTLAGTPVADYEVVLRESGDDGEVLYVVVAPASYTDVDLENFIGDLIENDENVVNVEVFDTPDAVAIFRKPASDQTAAELVVLDEHHLASLTDRHTIVFRGPFADVGVIAIGS